MTITAEVNVTVNGKGYCVEVEGEDYEGADPSVGIMRGGFTSFVLTAAEDDDGNEVFCGLLAELQESIEADLTASEKVIVALNEAADDACRDDWEG